MTEQVWAVKHCGRCDTDQPLDQFAKDINRHDGLCPWCKSCNRAYQRARHEREPDRRWGAMLFSRYGITAEEYLSMLDAQESVCAICHKPNNQGGRRMHVDHDHATGAVRGLLCNHCNAALGHVQDDVELLRRMIDYVEAVRVRA